DRQRPLRHDHRPRARRQGGRRRREHRQRHVRRGDRGPPAHVTPLGPRAVKVCRRWRAWNGEEGRRMSLDNPVLWVLVLIIVVISWLMGRRRRRLDRERDTRVA